MPKTIPGGLDPTADLTHWATCVKITRKDSTVLGFTDHDKDIVVSAVTYKSALSYSRSAVRTGNATQVDTNELQGVLDSTEISDADINSGKYMGAVVEEFMVDWTSPASGIIKLRTGTIGQVTRGQNAYTAEVQGLSSLLQTEVGTYYSPTCRNDLGDSICQVNTAALAQTGTVTSVTDRRNFHASGLSGNGPRSISYTASTIKFGNAAGETNARTINDSANGFVAAGFTAQDAITVTGSAKNDATFTILSLTAGQIIVTGGITFEPAGVSVTLTAREAAYFELGVLTWLTGNNAGISQEVRDWDGTNALATLLLAPNAIQVGDTFSIIPGCDKRVQTCVKKFNNLLGPTGNNGGFNGEPFVAGQDAILIYPNGV